MIEDNDLLENVRRLNLTRHFSMCHWITLWFGVLVVVFVLYLRVPTQAMHPKISSKRPFLCGNLINIDYGIIHYSMSLLCQAGLVMCNSTQPENQAKYYVVYTRQQIWIQKSWLWLFTYFCISEYNMFVCIYFELWCATYDLQISILLNFGTYHSQDEA